VPTQDELKGQLALLGAELDFRINENRRLMPYDEGGADVPTAIVQGRLTRAYRTLVPSAEAPWGSLVVDSVQDRLEVAGLRDDDSEAADRAWEIWQANSMDAESKLAHRSALIDGRAFGLVWPDPDTKEPSISLDDSSQMVVQYREGSRRHRVAALRRWVDDDEIPYATLYRRDGIYKFVGKKHMDLGPNADWERRTVRGEPWPLPNPLDSVPVVELAINRRLKPGSFGYARGEFAHCTGLIDRINLLTFVGMVVAIWMGFPLRGVIGDKIVRDDDGNPLPPFESRPDSVAQFESPEAKTFQFDAADRKNLSVFAELQQFALITKTPRHYFPTDGGLSNISADTIRADEGALSAKSTGHKASLGEGWEEISRLAAKLEGLDLSPQAEIVWKDHESRSLAERADAATKLASIAGMPFEVVAEKALNATQAEIARWTALGASDVFQQVLTAAVAPPEAPQNGAQPANGVPAVG
jgi:hypothetical protein